MMKEICLLTFFLMGLLTNVCGQQCEWLNQGKGLGYNISRAMTVDNNDDVVVTGSFDSTLTLGDTTFYLPTSIENSASFIVKYTHEGKFLWATRILYDSKSQLRGKITDVACDRDNNVYVTGIFDKTIDFGGGNIINHLAAGEKVVFLAKYDLNGKFIWVRKFILHAVSIMHSDRAMRLTVDAENNVVVMFKWMIYMTPEGGPKLTGTGQYSRGHLTILKYDRNGNYQWAKVYMVIDYQEDNGIECDSYSNIYFTTLVGDSLTGGPNMRAGYGVWLVKLDKNGNELNTLKIHTYYYDLASNLSVFEDGRIVVAGSFKDSVDILGTKVYKSPGSSHENQYLAFFNADFTLKWVIKNTGAGRSTPLGLSVKNHNIYFGGTCISDKFGMHTVNTGGYSGFYMVKADTLANILWAFGGAFSGAKGSAVRDVATDSYGNGYLTGDFFDTLNIFGKAASDVFNSQRSTNYFVAKIVDYTITRGYVYPGPYCAGDSIFIPYTKTGKYDWGNEFIAEISDSSGSFDYPVELGRLKDTVDGIIHGVLPLLSVPTNNKYRIRVLSTMPGVTSFYKKDTLRLLIYSKDSANAGKDTLICEGQKVRLKTTGGSRWDWSPAASLDNSAINSPVASPIKDTQYRIIISDSSRCGNTDTDYVWVRVRPPLKAYGNFTDSIACRNAGLLLKTTAEGGDSSAYTYAWEEKTGSNYTILQNGPLNSLPVIAKNASAYRMVLHDGCSATADTILYTIGIDTAITLVVPPNTSICKGDTANLKVRGFSCDNTRNIFEWRQNNIVVATSASVMLLPQRTTTYTVLLKDTIGKLYDTGQVTVFVDDTFALTATTDTTVCVGETISLRAQVTSCNANNNFLWTKDNDTTVVSHSAHFIVSPFFTATYRVIAENKVSGLADTAYTKITVRPPLSLSLSAPDSICEKQTATLRAVPNGGDSTRYKLLWTNSSWASDLNPVTVAPKATATYTANLTDNCSPPISDSVVITVLPNPVANFDFNYKEGCPPLYVSFSDLSLNNDTSKNIWQIQNRELLGSNPAYRFLNTGTYDIGLMVTNTLNCTDKITKKGAITVFEKPTAIFVVKPDIIEAEKETYLFNQSLKANSFSWDLGDNIFIAQNSLKDTVYSYKDTGSFTIRLVAENDKGCKDTSHQTVHVHDRMTCIIPNAFTPNRDDLNSIFAPVCTGLKSYSLTIFNRWGQTISNCENCSWDGTHEGQPVQQGVYMYIIHTQAQSGRKETLYGLVNVLR